MTEAKTESLPANISGVYIDESGDEIRIDHDKKDGELIVKYLTNMRPNAYGNYLGKYVRFMDVGKLTFIYDGAIKWSNKTIWRLKIKLSSPSPPMPVALNCGSYVIPTTKDKLYEYLCAAMSLELSTLPLYITAYYSFKDTCGETAKAAKKLLFDVLLEEMFHMNIVSNIIASIYSIDYVTTKFNIKYGKGCKLPAQVRADLNDVGLLPFSKDVLYNVFIQIEAPTTLTKESSKIITDSNGNKRYPFEPEPGKDEVILSFIKHDAYNEIGEFYNSIKKGLTNLSNKGEIDFKFDNDKHMQRICVKNEANDNKHTIRTLNDALHAIDIICEQGEGYSLTPGIFSAIKKHIDGDDDIKNDIETTQEDMKSHFVKFIELLVGRKLLSMHVDSETDNILTYKFKYESGNNKTFAVDCDKDIYSIKNFKKIADDKLFNDDYKHMLELLTAGLKKGDIKDSIGAMRKLKTSFKNCMDKGVYPDFKVNSYPDPPKVDVYQDE